MGDWVDGVMVLRKHLADEVQLWIPCERNLESYEVGTSLGRSGEMWAEPATYKSSSVSMGRPAVQEAGRQ